MKNKSNAALAAFGVASAVSYISPSAEATIVDLTVNPSSFGFQPSFGTVQVGSLFSFGQWNDSIGKTIFSASSASIGFVAQSSSVVANQFGGAGSIYGISPNNSATAFLGFNAQGYSGWLQIDFGGTGGAINYLDGAYEDSGGAIHVGSGSDANVPVSSTLGLMGLGLLAAGAAGKRRTARQNASQA